MGFLSNLGLVGFFIGMVLAYSVLPLPTDFSIVGLVAIYNPLVVLAVALAGATLGSITTYYIGRKGLRRIVKRNLPEREKVARKLFDRYGSASLLLFSWLPLIGDPLILVAGTLKMRFYPFLAYTTASKVTYFLVLIWFSNLIPWPVS
jgi:membrane protein YqaA with SNARE-associated domain